MRRHTLAAALAGALALAPAAAQAHQGNPNMQSVVRSVTPHVPGLSLQVLNGDDRFELDNRSGKAVLIYGYTGEPYARVLPDGTVQVNKNSQAYYLNADRTGTAPIPATAHRGAPVAWSTVDDTGRFQWHDHRMHYMGTGVPPSVKDRSKPQKVFDYAIPIAIGGRKGAIHGTLLWKPLPGGGPPAGAIVALVLVALAGLAAVVVVRRRRSGPGGTGGTAGSAPPTAEAW